MRPHADLPRRTAPVWILLLLFFALPAHAQLVLFEDPGITLGNDPVECLDFGTYRSCESLFSSERILSHDDLPSSEQIPLDFHLYLPPAPATGTDGNYPLVIFFHGWNGHRNSTGGGVEAEMVPYAESGYAVLAYSARAWQSSCGPAQRFDLECALQWNHLAASNFEVRDGQYIAGLLTDELSDTGDPLIDPQRIGVTGVSYGGGQSTTLAGLRNRVVNQDGSMSPWTSPLGTPLQVAAAAPYWAWIDLSYSLLPNGRLLDYVTDGSYRGPFGSHPFGVTKTTYVSGLFATGQINSVFAPPGQDPDLNAWKATIDAGEPYTEQTIGPIVDAITDFRSGYYRIDPNVPPAPILFNSGWSDDLFPVNEPVRYIHRVKDLFGADFPAKLVASDYGHDRATSADSAFARAAAREWFDYWLMGIGSEPGPDVRARTQSCPTGNAAADHQARSWHDLAPGELRFFDVSAQTVLSSGGPSSQSAGVFDPIGGSGACARVGDQAVAGTVVFDLPAPDPGGYTVMGSPTVIADLSVTGANVADTLLAARLLDIDANGTELLLARGVYRPDASGQQVFQLTPIGYDVLDGHHLQLELLGHEAPTFRQSNATFSIDVSNVEIRIPLAQAPDGGQIQSPAPKLVPAGYELVPEPGFALGLISGGLALALARRRSGPA